MKFVLHLKHWQLFVLIFALPMVLYMVFFMSMFMTVFAGNGFADEEPTMPSFPAAMIVVIVLFALTYLSAMIIGISWVYNLSTGLYQKLPPNHNMKIKRFYFAFFYPIVYIALILVCAGIFAAFAFNSPPVKSQSISPAFGLFFLIIPLHFLAMACMFYILYFMAKSLKSVELQKEAEINDYITDFILLWFSFIGIWFIQPRVNKIFSSQSLTSDSGGPVDRM